jgi:methyl-accepting chemotaxis protein
VNKSGETLGQINTSVKKVSDISAEIAAASLEQSSGIEQVNRAVSHMDEMTQQNASLVEEAAAASQSVTGQAERLMQLVSFFSAGNPPDNLLRVSQRQTTQRKRLTAETHLPHANPAVPTLVTSSVTPGNDDNWEEF